MDENQRNLPMVWKILQTAERLIIPLQKLPRERIKPGEFLIGVAAGFAGLVAEYRVYGMRKRFNARAV